MFKSKSGGIILLRRFFYTVKLFSAVHRYIKEECQILYNNHCVGCISQTQHHQYSLNFNNMKSIILLLVFASAIHTTVKAQNTNQEFDTALFNNYVKISNYFTDCEYYTQYIVDTFSKAEDIHKSDWFSFSENGVWHTICGNSIGKNFLIKRHVIFDSLHSLPDFNSKITSPKLEAVCSAVALSNEQFQNISDTCNFYISTFIKTNSDSSISIWFLPTLQPSGQAIYGCEWEYVFDKTGKYLLKKNSFTNKVTSVWIGKPRELWLNYRNTKNPTLGSVFFAISFRDYFTRIRIDTQIRTISTFKDASGNYTWTHKDK